ncbi:DENN (AEX-3) domain [Pelomyxa schiedti]|nr:DENN (AEX-3) domain [Pelomyxa schiedti]
MGSEMEYDVLSLLQDDDSFVGLGGGGGSTTAERGDPQLPNGGRCTDLAAPAERASTQTTPPAAQDATTSTPAAATIQGTLTRRDHHHDHQRNDAGEITTTATATNAPTITITTTTTVADSAHPTCTSSEPISTPSHSQSQSQSQPESSPFSSSLLEPSSLLLLSAPPSPTSSSAPRESSLLHRNRPPVPTNALPPPPAPKQQPPSVDQTKPEPDGGGVAPPKQPVIDADSEQQRFIDYFLVVKATKERFMPELNNTASLASSSSVYSISAPNLSTKPKGISRLAVNSQRSSPSLSSSPSPRFSQPPASGSRDFHTRLSSSPAATNTPDSLSSSASGTQSPSSSSSSSSATSSALSCSPPQHDRDLVLKRGRSASTLSSSATELPSSTSCENILGPFKAEVVDRIPVKDYPKSPVPPLVWMLCFPNGAILAKEPKPPKFFTFVVTEVNGSKYFGTALTVYQPNEFAPIDIDELFEESPNIPLFTPVCLCILSRFAFYNTFKQLLMAIYKVSRIQSNAEIVANFVKQVVYNIPLPPAGYTLHLPLVGHHCNIVRPKQDNFPLVEIPFRYLFDCIGIDAVVSLVVGVLEEKRVLFLSRIHSLLTIAAETLISLLYPFRYLHVYIPTLNSSLGDYLQAPTPYIMGMITDSNTDSLLAELSDVIIVNLDTSRIVNKDIPSSMAKCSLSPQAIQPLTDKLHAVLHPSIVNLDNAFALEESPMWVTGGTEPCTKVSEDAQIRLVWLEFFTGMLHQFRSNLRVMRKYPKPIFSFDKKQFIRAQPPHLQDFARAIVDTPAFTDMVDVYFLHSRSMFDLSICHYSQHHNLDQLHFSIESSMPMALSPAAQFPSELNDTGRYYDFPTLQPFVISDPLPVPSSTPNSALPPDPSVEFSQDTDYIESDDATPNFQKNKELVEPFIRALFVSEQADVHEPAPFSVLNGNASGVLAFTTLLVSYMHTHQQKHNDMCLTNVTFDVLSTLLLICLGVSNDTSDFRSPAQLVGVVTSFYQKIDTAQECLAYRIGSAPIWKLDEFWDFYFSSEIHTNRKTLDTHYKSYGDDWGTFSTSNQLLITQKEEEVIIRVLGSQVFLMLSLGVEAPSVKSFVNKVANQCSLQSDKHEQMIVLIKNLAKAHEESLAHLQTIKSKMKGLDKPATKSKEDPKTHPTKQPLSSSQILSHEKESTGLGVVGPEKKDGFTVTTLQGGIGPISCTSMHGHILLSGSTLGPISLWDTESLQFISKLTGHTDKVSAVHFGSSIVSSSCDSTLRVWDPSNHKFQLLPGKQFYSQPCDIDILYSGGADNVVRLWDMRMANSVNSLIGHKGPIRTLTESTLDAPSSIIVSAGDDNTIKVWDIKKMECLYTLEGHTDFITQVLFDSKTVISASYDCTLKCWDIQDSGRCTRTLTGHQGSVNCFVVDKLSSKIVSGSGDNVIRVWDAESPNCCAVLRGHSAEVTCLTCVDGWVVSGSEDKTVRVWTLNGDCMKQLRGHDDRLTSIYAPSKLRILSASRDSTARIWSITPPQPPSTSAFSLGHKKHAASVDHSHFTIMRSASSVNLKISSPLRPSVTPAATPTKSALPVMLHQRTLSSDTTKLSTSTPVAAPVTSTSSQPTTESTPIVPSVLSVASPIPSPSTSPTLSPVPPPKSQLLSTTPSEQPPLPLLPLSSTSPTPVTSSNPSIATPPLFPTPATPTPATTPQMPQAASTSAAVSVFKQHRDTGGNASPAASAAHTRPRPKAATGTTRHTATSRAAAALRAPFCRDPSGSGPAATLANASALAARPQEAAPAPAAAHAAAPDSTGTSTVELAGLHPVALVFTLTVAFTFCFAVTLPFAFVITIAISIAITQADINSSTVTPAQWL